jgi:hypothetical protein
VAGEGTVVFHPCREMKPANPPNPIADRANGMPKPTLVKGSRKRARPRKREVSATAGRRNR